MRNKKHITLFGILIYIIGFTSVLASQNNEQLEEKLNEIIQDAILRIYTDPIGVIKIGDSLYKNSSNDVNEKVTGLLLMTDAFIAVRNYPQALQNINEAKELLGEKMFESIRIKILNRFAYQHFQLHLHDEALKYLNESSELNERNTTDKSYLSNRGYINIVKGLIYRQLMGCDIAIRYMQRALNDYGRSAEELTKINLSVIHYNIGNCFISLENYEKAKEHFDLAYSTADIYGHEQNSLKLFANKGIANYYHVTNQFQEAINTLNKLSLNAEKVGDKSLMRSVASDLEINYLEIDDWEHYKIYSEKHKNLDDDIKSSEIKATMYALQNMEESHIQNMTKLDAVFNKIIIQIVIFSILILSIVTILIFRKIKKIKKVKDKIFNS